MFSCAASRSRYRSGPTEGFSKSVASGVFAACKSIPCDLADSRIAKIKKCFQEGISQGSDIAPATEKAKCCVTAGDLTLEPFLVQGSECYFTFLEARAFAAMRSQLGFPDGRVFPSLVKGDLYGGPRKFDADAHLPWFTEDRQFMVIEMDGAEALHLHSFSQLYIEHLSGNPDSLLPRVLGAFELIYDGQTWNLGVIANPFYTNPVVEEVYDLQGDTEDRFLPTSQTGVQQDMNLEDKLLMVADEDKRRQFLTQMLKDSDFLCSHNISGYSLVLGFQYGLDRMGGASPKKGSKGFSRYFKGIRAVVRDALPTGAETPRNQQCTVFPALATRWHSAGDSGWLTSLLRDDASKPQMHAQRFQRFCASNFRTSDSSARFDPDDDPCRSPVARIRDFAETGQNAMKQTQRNFPEIDVGEAIRFATAHGGSLAWYRADSWGIARKVQVFARLSCARKSVILSGNIGQDVSEHKIFGFEIWQVFPSLFVPHDHRGNSKSTVLASIGADDSVPLRSFTLLAFGELMRFEAPTRELMKLWVTALETLDNVCSSGYSLLNMAQPENRSDDGMGKLGQYCAGILGVWRKYFAHKAMCLCDEGATMTLTWMEVENALNHLQVDEGRREEARSYFNDVCGGMPNKFAEENLLRLLQQLTNSKEQQQFSQRHFSSLPLKRLAEIQNEKYSSGEIARFLSMASEHCPKLERKVENLTNVEISRMLRSEANVLLDVDRAYDDMTHPLSHYWIASSHNTYLEDPQFLSQSCCRMYVVVLSHGCRSVELDVWDGPSGDPVITHGYAGCTDVSFDYVCKAIEAHAFESTDYPLILNIRQHCAARNLHKQAATLRKVFGDKLLTPEIDKETRLPKRDDRGNPLGCLPSPAEARGRIIVQCEVTGVPGFDGIIAMPTKKAQIQHLLEDYSRTERQVTVVDEHDLRTVISSSTHETQASFTSKHLLRAYPQGIKLGASNPPDVAAFWAAGVQMVALNYLTIDQAFILNEGLFAVNGGSGYVLKPPCLLDPRVAPKKANISLIVLSGYRLPGGNADILKPKVRVTVCSPAGCTNQETKAAGGGFGPIWETPMQFETDNYDMTHLLFEVIHSNEETICHHAIPLRFARQGYRVVPLLGAAISVPVKHALLLVKLDCTFA
mmetsp:Transcript_14589/g.32161  ORF Transcript_14589/g.32161 Transcript_14589/m.32161 type:complete len:1136 (-) Transcript_14589:62-3469(-)